MSNANVTLEELGKARADLEGSIYQSLRAFEERYGVAVDSVHVTSLTEIGYSSSRETVGEVNVRLRL